MPFSSPKLDDRRFEDLVLEAQGIIRRRCPGWTDFTPSDPGMTLIEVFAFLTDVMLYRLNRIPEKVYVALLDLLGISPLAPAAATVTLTFSRSGDGKAPLRLPAGTRVSDPTNSVTFVTSDPLALAPDQASGTVTAVHCENLEGELIGTGTGEAGQSFRVRHPPIVRLSGEERALLVGVEADPTELHGDWPAREYGGKAFILWREVPSFLGLGDNDKAYTASRVDGLITFAPARGIGQSGAPTLAPVPGKGKEIRVWYRRGGGRAGNVAPGTLTVMKDQIPGVLVSNAARASGGEDGESVEQALVRGREAVRVLSSAVTARDYERIALEAGGVARAKAYAQRDVWVFGEPGVVEVRIVPAIDTAALPQGAVTSDVVAAHQTAELMQRVDTLLAARRPLGVKTRILWTGCQPVAIAARIVISRAENADAVKTRLLQRLNALLSPAGTWPIGKTLRASDVYEAILSEPGVRYAEGLHFTITDGPTSDVIDLVRDPRQARTFYAASAQGLFRSLDNGASWTKILAPPGEVVVAVRPHQEVPGMLVAITRHDPDSWPVYHSLDGGESWTLLERIQNEQVYDAAWINREARPLLFLATRKGLRRMEIGTEQGSKTTDLVAKDAPSVATEGFYAVATARHALGIAFVAVAAREKAGVFVSRQAGQPGSFELVPGSVGKDIRVLAFMRSGDRSFLWAGITAEAGGEGEGALRIEARADGLDPGGWTAFAKGWRGGKCEQLDFVGTTVFATSDRAGILSLDSAAAQPSWWAPPLDCGLPINDDRKALAPTMALASGPTSGDAFVILAGTRAGTYASTDSGKHYVQAGQTAFSDHVPLPPNWLYCSGAHDLAVVHDIGEGEG
jgi:hypothetical protein